MGLLLHASFWLGDHFSLDFAGNVFIGAVHDYLTLMVSVRNRGSSIADIAESTMGYRAKAVFAIFLVWQCYW
ncbi:MAG: hypothetical protein Ct9H300mP23_07540 [Nitrospinota bacterium]|nr:MAG: hypothetical protein Ct9H300mP23_07540 [Nitrospinota bacterium]